MSAGGAGEAKGGYPAQTIMALGIVGGLVGIYLGNFMLGETAKDLGVEIADLANHPVTKLT